jgi:hypothetical protein
MIDALSTLCGEEDEDAEETGPPAASGNPKREALEILMATMRNWSRAVADGRRSIGGRWGRVIALIGARMAPRRASWRMASVSR